MARFVHIEYPTQHGGVTRFAGAIESVGNLSLGNAGLSTLAFIGAPFTRSAARVRLGLAAWAARREQRHQDEKLWNVALGDARVMADLSRAMSRDAAQGARDTF
jgi:hypothetical protein